VPVTEYIEATVQSDLDQGLLQTLEGTLQRVNYKLRELTVVAQCQVWHFRLDRACQCWFDDKPTVLRCFHPLDQVKFVYSANDEGLLAQALYAWEK
jgi:hypothetical protein